MLAPFVAMSAVSMVRDNGDARTGTEPSLAPISLSTPSSPSSDARAAMIWSTPTSVSDGSSKSPSACHEHGNVFNSLSIVSPHTLCNASPCLNMKMSFVFSLDFKRRRMPFHASALAAPCRGES